MIIQDNGDYGVVIRRFDNHHLNNNAESDGRRNGVININAHLKSEDSLDKQQQLETFWLVPFFWAEFITYCAIILSHLI